MRTKEINLKSEIKFINRTDNMGRAEFVFCPVFKGGMMRELFIYRLQQENKEKKYHLNLEKLGYKKTDTFLIMSWAHKTDNPTIWRNFWCKEHKTIAFEVYVPLKTDKIVFEYHFGNTLDIRFE